MAITVAADTIQMCSTASCLITPAVERKIPTASHPRANTPVSVLLVLITDLPTRKQTIKPQVKNRVALHSLSIHRIIHTPHAATHPALKPADAAPDGRRKHWITFPLSTHVQMRDSTYLKAQGTVQTQCTLVLSGDLKLQSLAFASRDPQEHGLQKLPSQTLTPHIRSQGEVGNMEVPTRASYVACANNFPIAE